MCIRDRYKEWAKDGLLTVTEGNDIDLAVVADWFYSLYTNYNIPVSYTHLAIAKEVIAGKWSNGIERKRRLEAAGYNYAAIQKIVNKLLE